MNKIVYSYLLVFTLLTNQNNIQLFNGNDLSGWVNYGGGKFYVEDECIVAISKKGLPNTFLHSEKKYQNFELEFDVKLDTKPFCSKRCNYIDLNNWLGEKYTIHINEEDYEKDV